MQYAAWFFSSIPLLIISLTMLARANDLRWRKGLHWNFRLIGFIMAGFAPWGVMGLELSNKDLPSIYEMMFRVGLMFVFLTTPYLPPWWKWISGYDDELERVRSSGWGDEK